MPPRKRGKGFTRKKKKSSPGPTNSGTSRKKSTAGKPPKTPVVASKSAASTSKRKERQALALSLPRRVSPRLQEIKSRKMMINVENGSLVMPSSNVSGSDHGGNMQQQQQQEAHDQDATTEPVDDHVEDQGDHREGDEDEEVPHNNSRGRMSLKMKAVQNHNNKQDGTVAEDDDANQVQDSDEDSLEEHEDVVWTGRPPPSREIKPPVLSTEDAVKGVEDDYHNHAVLMYFWKTGGCTVTSQMVSEWIYSNVGDLETIGSITRCRYLGRGFFSVYFELATARRKALATKSREGPKVAIFPWCADTVNEQGEQCYPRMIVLPGLPDQFLPLLPRIGASLGTCIGSIGVGDPDHSHSNGWDVSACFSDAASPKVAVMMPEAQLPKYIELRIRAGVSKRQPIYEHSPFSVSGSRRKSAAAGGTTPGSSKRAAGNRATPRGTTKKLKA